MPRCSGINPQLAHRVLMGWLGWLVAGLVGSSVLWFESPAQADTPGFDPAVSNSPPSEHVVLESQHLVQSGTFAPGTNWQEVRFSAPVKGRYFCLEALSSQDGQPAAAVAELDVLDEAGKPLSHDGWTIAGEDSEDANPKAGPAQNAIDGEAATCWHTRRTGLPANYPHHLIVDLGRSWEISGFRYLPRQGDPEADGRIKDYQVSVGDQIAVEASPEDLLPKKCFLFSYFTGDDQVGLHLAWSLDGYQWEPLNHGFSFLESDLGGTNLLRDPCLLLGPDGIFRVVWTMAWGGNSIGYASSKDLVHWSPQQALPVMAGEPGTVNCWAPEIYWEKKRAQYLIIWASMVAGRFPETLKQLDGANNQRLYFTTTKNFHKFTPTRLLYNPGFSLIDPTILPARGRYYLFFKDETAHPQMKNVRMAVGDDWEGPYQPPGPPFSPSLVEGPAVYAAGGGYVCIFHNYASNRWGAMQSKDLEHWTDVTERMNLPPYSHPGTVLEVPREVLVALWQAGRADIGSDPATADLGLGCWIWTDTVADKQTCRLWRSFAVTADSVVSRAILNITADNGYRVFLDGREVGRGGDFNDLTEYDLTQLMTPGRHVLAVEGFNDSLAAGVIAGLHIQMANGRHQDVLTDTSWFVAPNDEAGWTTRRQPGDDWQPARIVGFAGKFDWQRPDRILTLPPLLPQIIRFWQRGWFLSVILAGCALVLGFSLRQGLKLAVQTRSNKLLERERDRIARDIHDDMGAGLTQLTLLGELVLRETPPDAATRDHLDSLCGKSRALLGTMDELVWTVNSRRDTLTDFAAFICEHAQEFLATTAIRCRLDVPDDLPPVPLDLPARRNLLLAVKEAVRNAARHSGASELCLQIRVADQTLSVVIEDNGRGFKSSAGPGARNGLKNMAERLADVGGGCRITAAGGGGCRVLFLLPLQPPALARNWAAVRLGKLFRRSRPVDAHS